MIKPMLAKTWLPDTKDPGRFPAFAMPKLNGVRALFDAKTGQFYTRRLEVWNPVVLAHIKPPVGEFVLDGELYCHDLSLQDINSLIGVNNQTAKPDAVKVEYWLFDVLTAESADKRYKRLRDLMASNHWQMKGCQLVTHHRVNCPGTLTNRHMANIAMNYEGTMIKPFHGKYETDTRSNFLWKWKAWDTEWFYVVGRQEGVGRLCGSLGALLVQHDERGLVTPFPVGTGPALTDNTRKELWVGKQPKRALVKFCGKTKFGIPIAASVLEVTME